MSRTKAINEKCKDCIYDPADQGTWREQVERCTSGPTAKVPCSLWPYRPITVHTLNKNRAEKGNDAEINALVDALEDE